MASRPAHWVSEWVDWKCRTGKWRNKYLGSSQKVENVGPENGGPENGRPEIAGPSITCSENAGIMSVISDRNAVKSKTVHTYKRLRFHSHYCVWNKLCNRGFIVIQLFCSHWTSWPTRLSLSCVMYAVALLSPIESVCWSLACLSAWVAHPQHLRWIYWGHEVLPGLSFIGRRIIYNGGQWGSGLRARSSKGLVAREAMSGFQWRHWHFCKV